MGGKVKEGVTEKTTVKKDDQRPEPSEGVYYMIGPFGPLDRILVRCGGGIVLAAVLGSTWALWSIAGTLKDICLTLKGR